MSLAGPQSAMKTAIYEGKAFTPSEWTYVEWRNRQRSLDRFAGAMISRSILRRAGDVREVTTAQVSADFLDIIGAQPVLGRVFSHEEDQAGRDSVALLEFGFWKREFGGDANVLGWSVMLDERPVTIIGVLPRGVRFPGRGPLDVWVPHAARPSVYGSGRGAILAIGRLRPGVSREGAQAEMDAIARQIARERTKHQTGSAVVTPLHEWLVGEARMTLFMLSESAHMSSGSGWLWGPNRATSSGSCFGQECEPSPSAPSRAQQAHSWQRGCLPRCCTESSRAIPGLWRRQRDSLLERRFYRAGSPPAERRLLSRARRSEASENSLRRLRLPFCGNATGISYNVVSIFMAFSCRADSVHKRKAAHASPRFQRSIPLLSLHYTIESR